MSNSFKIPKYRQDELMHLLFLAGFTEFDITSIIKKPYLAHKMYAAIHPNVVKSSSFWYVSPDQQLARAHRFWRGADLPDPPENFTPRTESEVLLLHVPDSLERLWQKVVAPKGYIKSCFGFNINNLLLAPNKVEYKKPVWLAFDPEHGKGQTPESFWDETDIAASEVLSAMIQFPEWLYAWPNGASAPYLAGYRTDEALRPCVPYLIRGADDNFIQLNLTVGFAYERNNDWSSPSVREC